MQTRVNCPHLQLVWTGDVKIKPPEIQVSEEGPLCEGYKTIEHFYINLNDGWIYEQQFTACRWLPDTKWGSSALFPEICTLWEEIICLGNPKALTMLARDSGIETKPSLVAIWWGQNVKLYFPWTAVKMEKFLHKTSKGKAEVIWTLQHVKFW